MTKYSPEPSRKDCLFHLDTSQIVNNQFLDQSPQENNGSIVGDPDLVTGKIGNTVQFGGEEQVNVEINDSGIFDHTMSAWVYIDPRERGSGTVIMPDTNGDNGLYYDNNGNISFRTETSSTSHSGPRTTAPVDEWFHVCGMRDGSVAKLYINGSLVGTEDFAPTDEESILTSPIRIGGKQLHGGFIQDFDYSLLDDPRMYDRALTEAEIDDIISIGNEHNSIRDFGTSWDNDGIPFRGSNRQLGGALVEEKDRIFRQLDYIEQSHHIDDASGPQLDKIGRVGGIRRREGEDDSTYRARIKATIAAGRSNATFEDIVEITASILDTSIENVTLRRDLDNDPATAQIYVNQSDLDSVDITASDLTSILGGVVTAGHDIEALSTSANPFTLRSDGQTNDPSLGLTSDNISTGGALVEDL